MNLSPKEGTRSVTISTAFCVCTEQIYSSVALYTCFPIVKSTDKGALYAVWLFASSTQRDVTPSTTPNGIAVSVLTAAGNVDTCSVNRGIAQRIKSLSSPIVPPSRPFSLAATVIRVQTLSIVLSACIASASKLPCNSLAGALLERLNLSFTWKAYRYVCLFLFMPGSPIMSTILYDNPSNE